MKALLFAKCSRLPKTMCQRPLINLSTCILLLNYTFSLSLKRVRIRQIQEWLQGTGKNYKEKMILTILCSHFTSTFCIYCSLLLLAVIKTNISNQDYGYLLFPLFSSTVLSLLKSKLLLSILVFLVIKNNWYEILIILKN